MKDSCIAGMCGASLAGQATWPLAAAAAQKCPGRCPGWGAPHWVAPAAPYILTSCPAPRPPLPARRSGSASAVALLFRSHEAEAEGSTAIVYDWTRNTLEAVSGVDPGWAERLPELASAVAAAAARHAEEQLAATGGGTAGGYCSDDLEALDPALLLCSPRAALSAAARSPCSSAQASDPPQLET